MTPAPARPRLLFTIDVEEDMPDWRITDPVTTHNVAELPRLHALCRDLGVRPTYLCNYPVVTQRESMRVLESLMKDGDCEIGTHLHPWNTPPFHGIPGRTVDERTVPYYLYELGPDRFRTKLATMTRAIRNLTGHAPVSFRAGRFGLDTATLHELAPQGYRVDSSVTPLVHHKEDGGPDFRRAPQIPYRPHRENLLRRGDAPILEIPVSVGLTRLLPSPVQKLYVLTPRTTRIRGLLSKDYLRAVDFGWLYPPRFGLRVMQQVANTLVRSGNPILNVFIHSSEIVPGASAPVQTAADVTRVFERLKGILTYCVEDLGAVPRTLEEVAEEMRPQFGLDSRPARSANGHVHA